MITIKDLQNLRRIINIKELTSRAGLSYNGIVSKLKNGNELTVTQSQKFTMALKYYGLYFEQNPQQPENLFNGGR